MKKIIPYILVLVIICGGVAFWKYSGVGEAVTAQKEIQESGLYYKGETWMSAESFKELKQSLSEHDPSLQTSSDLEILPETRGDDNLLIKYSFLSVKIYNGLDGTHDLPSSIKGGLAISTDVMPMLFVVGLLILAMRLLPLDKSNSQKEE